MSGRASGIVIGLSLASAAVWWGAGWVLERLSLPEADPLARLGAVLALLALAERVLARRTPPH
jgi:hypothetical protein